MIKTKRFPEEKRLRELGDTAIDRLLVSMDWDAREWLDDDERPEYPSYGVGSTANAMRVASPRNGASVIIDRKPAMQRHRDRIDAKLQEEIKQWPLARLHQELGEIRWHIRHGCFGSYEFSWELVLQEEIARRFDEKGPRRWRE